MRPLLRALEILSVLELLSVLVLFGNLLITRADGIAGALGPIHGALYLTVAVTAMFGRGLLWRTRLLALVPLLGGVFTLVNVRGEAHRTVENGEGR